MAGSSAPYFFDALAMRFHLTQNHSVILPTSPHEFLVGAALDDASLFQQEDQIGTADGREPMGDHKGCSPGEQLSHGRLNELLAFCVQVARGLVEDEDLR